MQSSNNSVSASTTLATHTSRGEKTDDDNLGAQGKRPVMPSGTWMLFRGSKHKYT